MGGTDAMRICRGSFLIEDQQTGTILFMSSLFDPATS
jgi:hypothetical protein